MRLPIDQWQFYVVSVVALAGIWALVRPFLSRGSSSGGCSRCVPASRSGSRRPVTPLTIDGRRR